MRGRSSRRRRVGIRVVVDDDRAVASKERSRRSSDGLVWRRRKRVEGSFSFDGGGGAFGFGVGWRRRGRRDGI